MELLVVLIFAYICEMCVGDALSHAHYANNIHDYHPVVISGESEGFQWSDLLDVQHATSKFLTIATTEHEFSKNFDDALTVRPWWVVVDHGIINNKAFTVLQQVLDQEQRAVLELLVQFNFPSKSSSSYPTCEQRRLMVSVHDGDTWGNRYINVKNEIDNCLRSDLVFAIYGSSSGHKTDVMYFSGPTDCEAYVNKWECLFLPSTNCSLPAVLLACQDRSCLPTSWGHGLYSTASATGTMLPDRQESYPKPIRNNQLGIQLTKPQFRVLKSLALPEEVSNTTVQTSTVRSELSISSIFYNFISTRFNSDFRIRIFRLVNKFRVTNAELFHAIERGRNALQSVDEAHPMHGHDLNEEEDTSKHCVAMHIRMDDRKKTAMSDMMEWCNRCALFDSNDNTANGRKHKRRVAFNANCTEYDEGAWCDYGCNTDLPYGMASLEHYLNASFILDPTIKHIFIMTDDLAWLHHQKNTYFHAKQAIDSQWTPHLHVFPLRPNHRSSLLSAAEDFWASITIAQQCKGFVGHFGSAATQFVYSRLCHYHDQRFMQCPDMFDLSGTF